jgi:nitroimidazol reductase NimA-like FMN-containing flavoprotein (pyridoxamine 5'-phosphate oxidase superfamily)
MKKEDREIKDRKVLNEVLKRGKYTTISLCRGNEPYLITLSYGFDQEKNALYFHTAKEGLKLEFLKENSQACGTVVEDKGYKFNECSHAYRSVVFWGSIVIIENIDEKKHAFEVLLNHLEEKPNEVKAKFLKNDDAYINPCILRLDISDISGKESK